MQMSKKLVMLILSLGLGAAASVQAEVPKFPPPPWEHPLLKPTPAPEIDPASAMSAFTLLAGGLMLIRGRRASK
jgi:hypothetical protein